MDSDTKITYAIVVVLIFVLGVMAYYLKGNIDLPQVQVINEATSTQDGINLISLSQNKRRNLLSKTESNKNMENNSTTTETVSTSTVQLPEKITSATITTNKGVIEIAFSNNTPETVNNFATLAVNKFYDGTRFHRVIRDFMIQGGDPLSKDMANKDRWGSGGPGYSFKDEFHADDTFPQGTLAMANAGPNTNGSQFFIVTAIAGTPWLIGKHTVFGHVTKGLDVALKIQDMQTDGAARPLQDVIIEKIEIH